MPLDEVLFQLRCHLALLLAGFVPASQRSALARV